MKPLIAVLVIVLIAIAGYFAFTYKAGAPVQEPTATTTAETPAAPTEDNVSAGDDQFSATVVYSDAGFSPSNVNVKVGETIRFVNTSGHNMWVGADEHPTHTEYDGTSTRDHCANGEATGGTFDQCQAVPAGSFWEYTFTKAGTWNYHNHARSGNGGTVTVTN